MPRIEASIEIAASPTTVFRFCHDLSRRPEWDERMVSAETITSGTIRSGSLIRIDAARAGRFQFTWEAEYTSYQLPSSSTLKVLDAAPTSPFKSGTETWQFSQFGEGTRFTLIWDYQSRGVIARITDSLGRRVGTRRAIGRSLINLKKLLESD